jgi:hypothetical protein
MDTNKPVIGNQVSTNKPVIKKIKDQLDWSFSFKYFKQIDFFGLGEMQTKWFVSLIDKLTELSKENINEFFKDHRKKEGNRYHPINWDSKNIPIERKDINWVDKNVIDNEDDYPFFQFQISTGLGRIIGFWQENYEHFFIVLLDPLHNMQPSKNFDYKVDPTTIQYCELASLLIDLDKIKNTKCNNNTNGCACKKEISKIPTKLNRGNYVYFQLEDEYYEDFCKKLEEKSIQEIIELGLLSS